ncbi:elongator complex protein 3 [Ammoniphilus sp. CFH 90114]|uniref:elongator complex protein 3 n=1 Tax=Ammoniphilus sp. CFH 90114 TaxID=2493665 RepID=UPI00100FF3CB|nr:radical SAM protein [Ammoniphilus sp. CFH 90114]RXT15082.1 radical SAM protein [Ammoniphilus sp. CFH 90114]
MIHRRIALFVPHQGCPKDCTFCNQSRITGQKREERLTQDQVRQTIEEHLTTIPVGAYVEIAYFGGSFTGLPRSYQKMLLEIAKEYIDAGKVQGIRFSTRPDYIADHIMEFLLPYGVTTIELGTQSLNDTVLELSQRGHTSAQVEKAVKTIRKYPGVQVGLQLLPGLPGDTAEIALETTRQAISLQPDFVRIYPALVIAGTELEWQYRTKQYTPLRLEEAIDMVADMWILFMKANIPVIRIGLHSSEDLRSEGTIIAGPFHPSFRQLVEAELFRRLLSEVAKAQQADLKEVRIHPADETAVRGSQGRNWKGFLEACKPSSPQLVLDRSLPRHEIECIWKQEDISKYQLSSLESS